MGKLEKYDIANVVLRVNYLERSVKDLGRKIDSTQKTLDLIYSDRELLTEIQHLLNDVKQMILVSEKHTEQLTEDVKNKVSRETQKMQVTLDQRTEEMRQETEEVKQEVPKNVVNQIAKTFDTVNKGFQKKSILSRLTRLLTFGRVK